MNTYETTFKRQDVDTVYRLIVLKNENLKEKSIKQLSNSSREENNLESTQNQP